MPIFDQGYQHWTGTLSGHASRWWTITRHGVRVGMKGTLLRLAVLLSWLPALALAFMLCLWGLLEQKSSLVMPLVSFLSGLFPPEVVADPKHYRLVVWTLCYRTFLDVGVPISMIVVLLVGPSLISQDLRFNALPLYFSRPLRRRDYFFGKLGVIAWFLSLVIILPSLIAYSLGLLFSLDVTILRDTFPLLLACVGYGAVVVLSAGSLMLALSSLSRNSRYVALFWVALWFVSGIVSSILLTVDGEQRRHHQYRAMRPHPGQDPARRDAAVLAQQQAFAQEWETAQSNWRPMVSYTANLSRIGQHLLRVDAAWEELSKFRPPQDRERFLLQYAGPRYPWYWSATMLAVLLGLSLCILNLRVRSLDRLM